MVGESDTVSPTFSFARTGLYWVGGFLFIFLTLAVMGSLMNQVTSGVDTRTPSGSAAGRPASSTRTTTEEPSMGLTPETATAVPE